MCNIYDEFSYLIKQRIICSFVFGNILELWFFHKLFLHKLFLQRRIGPVSTFSTSTKIRTCPTDQLTTCWVASSVVWALPYLRAQNLLFGLNCFPRPLYWPNFRLGASQFAIIIHFYRFFVWLSSMMPIPRMRSSNGQTAPRCSRM